MLCSGLDQELGSPALMNLPAPVNLLEGWVGVVARACRAAYARLLVLLLAVCSMWAPDVSTRADARRV
ncbi:MAG: hypothetical protein ABR549_16280 [Mycobacteriales bacterium]